MSKRITLKDWNKIKWAIGWHFGKRDEYANFDHTDTSEGKFEALVERDETGEVIAYIVYQYNPESCIEGLRSGVMRNHRGKGLSKKLYKRLLQIARKRGVPYRSYTHFTNHKSINSHLAAGMRIYKTDQGGGWVYFSSATDS